MPIYSQASEAMVYALINSSNPSLPVAASPSNVQLNAPAVITPGGNIQNTSMVLSALPQGEYIGKTTVTYRRIDLGSLFRAIPVVIYQYANISAGQSPGSINTYLAAINAKYGLSLTAADIANANLPGATTNAVPSIGLAAGTLNSSVTLAAATTSLGFVGNVTLYWVWAPNNINNLIVTPSLENARAYPGGLETVSSALYVPDLDVYGYDFTNTLNQVAASEGTNIANLINEICTNTMGNVNGSYLAQQTAFINAVNTAIGKSGAGAYSVVGPASTAMSIFGIQMHQAVLPSTAVPEADHKYFDGCMYLDLLPANSWGAGRMIFHYND